MADPLAELDEAALVRGFQATEFRFRGGYTRRYHGIRMIMEDTVGHHSYNVAQIIRFIAADLPFDRYGLLLCAALDHDVAECIVGDMPAPTKRRLPNYPGHTFREVYGEMEARVMEENGMDDVTLLLNAEEAMLLKAADAMDGMRFCMQEIRMGNTFAISIGEAFRSYVRDLKLPEMSRASRMFATFDLQWEALTK
jgi:5'-deoxynucleotidase YfbR-like HD superfamily hydrolase